MSHSMLYRDGEQFRFSSERNGNIPAMAAPGSSQYGGGVATHEWMDAGEDRFKIEADCIVGRPSIELPDNQRLPDNKIDLAQGDDTSSQERNSFGSSDWLDEDDLPEGPRPLRWGKILQFPTPIAVDEPNFMKQLLETVRYKEWIQAGAETFGFQASILCAMGSRASAWGLTLNPTGAAGQGKDGMGRGLMQFDIRKHEFARTGPWDNPEENILYACQLLSKRFDTARQTTKLRNRKLLRAALVGFDAGPGAVLEAVRQELDLDCFTTNQDYSEDILNRAGWFQLHGWI